MLNQETHFFVIRFWVNLGFLVFIFMKSKKNFEKTQYWVLVVIFQFSMPKQQKKQRTFSKN